MQKELVQTIGLNTDNITLIMILSLVAFVVAMLLTPIYTHYAFKYKWWKKKDRTVSTTGEKLSVVAQLRIKRTIPRMAGMVMVATIALVTIAFNLDRGQTWLPLAALVSGGIVGLIDDYLYVSGKGGGVMGLGARKKFFLITLIASIAALYFYYKLGYSSVHVPIVGDLTIGWLLIPLFILVVVSTSNAVNISDGMDGLAGGLLINAYAAFGVIALFQGNYGISGFCFTVAGALMSYLWFNIPPARFVMGDVGSFALGTSLGVVAMLTDTLLLLPVIGFVFVVEGGSSLVQITSKRLLKRKVFIAAPIHHHFEAMGWPKTKVTMRFWIISQACAVIGVVLAFTTGFIR
jgi:phospho-N-acetylmuramoyl-pentapeptide-transferase